MKQKAKRIGKSALAATLAASMGVGAISTIPVFAEEEEILNQQELSIETNAETQEETSSLPQSSSFAPNYSAANTVEELKEKLAQLIEEAEKIWNDRGGYYFYKKNSNIIQSVEKYIPAGKQYLEDGKSTAMTFSWKCYNLESAIKALNNEGNYLTEDVRTIYALNEEMLSMDSSKYTKETWEKYEAAVNAALTKANGSGAESKLPGLIQEIKDAQAALIEIDANLSLLKSLVSECEQIQNEGYSRDTWVLFTEALENASEEIRKNETTIEQETFDQLYNALNEGKSNLTIPETLESVEVGVQSAWTEKNINNSSKYKGGKLYISNETINGDGTTTLTITWINDGVNPLTGGQFKNDYAGGTYSLRKFTESDWETSSEWWIQETNGKNFENVYLTKEELLNGTEKTVTIPTEALQLDLYLHGWNDAGTAARDSARTWSLGTYYTKAAPEVPEITEISLKENDKDYDYVNVGEIRQLELIDQTGNTIDPSLLDFKLSNTKGYISIDENGLITGQKQATSTNAKTQVKILLKEDSSVDTYINVVVPIPAKVDPIQVATGSTSTYLKDFNGGAISDTASGSYYFQVKGNAEWQDHSKTDDKKGLPYVEWYVNDELKDTIYFGWAKNYAGISNPGTRFKADLTEYGKYTVKAVVVGKDGSRAETNIEIERTPIWLNTDGSVSKITANAGDVVIPSVVNGKTITTLGTVTKARMATLANTVTKGVLEGVTSIEIPETVTSISSDFFAGATDLQKIVFKGNAPEGVVDLSNTKLTSNSIVVPEEYKESYAEAAKQWTAPEGQTIDGLLGIDEKAPEVKVTYSNDNGNTVTSEDVTVTLESNEPIQDIDGWTRISETELQNVYSENGKYSVVVKDFAGNETKVDFEVKRIDKIDPIITLEGVEVNGWTKDKVTYTITEQSIKDIIIDGTKYNEKNAPKEITSLGKHTILVIDKAGNEASVSFEIVESKKPTITVKDTSVGTEGHYSRLDLKFYDESNVDYVLINGQKKDLTDNQWSDLNDQNAGYVQGENQVVLVDIYGNEAEFNFLYDKIAPDFSVKDSSVGSDGYYSRLDLKLHDNDKVDYVLINGQKKDLTDNQWSDLNDQNAEYVQGENQVVLVDIYGNETKMTFIYDTIAPEIKAQDIVLKKNESFDPLNYVQAIDNGENIEVLVTSNDVNTKKYGTYHVTYQASDKAGNVAEKTITVEVEKKGSLIKKVVKQVVNVVKKLFGWLF